MFVSVTSITDGPPEKRTKIKVETVDQEVTPEASSCNLPDECDETNSIEDQHYDCFHDSDSDFMSSDSDDELLTLSEYGHLLPLPLPLRLMSSAIKCSPELTAETKLLIELSKSTQRAAKAKLEYQTKKLELQNMKLQLEIKALERNAQADNTAAVGVKQDTTIYLHTS